MMNATRAVSGFGRRLLAVLCSLALACALLPAMAVPAHADDAVLVLKARNANSSAGSTVLRSFSRSDIDALEQHDGLAYLYGQETGAKVYVTESYVPVDTLISQAGGSPYWNSSSSLEFTVSGGLAYGKDSFGYSDVEQAQYFYPNLALAESGSIEWTDDGAVRVPAVMAFGGASLALSPGMTAQDAVDALAGVQGATGMPRYFSGVSASDSAAHALTAGRRSPQGVEQITIVYDGPADPAPDPTPTPEPAPDPKPAPEPEPAPDPEPVPTTRSLQIATMPVDASVSVRADGSSDAAMTGRSGDSFTIARDAAYTATVSAPGYRSQVIAIRAGADDVVRTVTLEAERTAPAMRSLRLSVAPATARVKVMDASGLAVAPSADGSFAIARDTACTVTVSAVGYRSQTLEVPAGSGNYAGFVTLEPCSAPSSGRQRPRKGQVVVAGSGASRARYQVRGVPRAKGAGRVFYRACALGSSARSATVPASVRIGGRTYEVTGISRGAFKGHAKLSTVKIAGTSLTGKTVRGSLKGSGVKRVKVPASRKGAYKKAFSKANCGRSVLVK